MSLLLIQFPNHDVKSRCTSWSVINHINLFSACIDYSVCAQTAKCIVVLCLCLLSDEPMWHFTCIHHWNRELVNKDESAAKKQTKKTLEVKLESGYEEKNEGIPEEVTLTKNPKPPNQKLTLKYSWRYYMMVKSQRTKY